MYTQDRDKLRQFYFDAWQKYQKKQIMEPMELMLAKLVALHPEYHDFFSNRDTNLDKDYLPENGETNPFLHLGLHLSIQEQLSIDQPKGVVDCYQRLLSVFGGDAHEVEHRMMDCLAEMIWSAQRNNMSPDEHAYLLCLKNL